MLAVPFELEIESSVQNKHRSRNSKGELVLKRHFEHPSIDDAMVNKVFEKEVLPWAKSNGLKLRITNNDSEVHSKGLTEMLKEH